LSGVEDGKRKYAFNKIENNGKYNVYHGRCQEAVLFPTRLRFHPLS